MEKLEMLKLRLDGESYQSIGLQAGVSRQRIQQLLSPPKVIRDIVVDRASGKCQRCGVLVGISGHCHHNGDIMETYNDIENLELLCLTCHREAHKDDYTSIYFLETEDIINTTSTQCKCGKCGYEWLPRSLTPPAKCPKCQSRKWDKSYDSK